jgi:hypothetical protein
MNNINMLNVPADCRLFCLVNYNAFATIVDKDGKETYVDLPIIEKPIIVKSLAEAKKELAEFWKVPVDLVDDFVDDGEEDGFCPSMATGFKTALMEAGYSFDVYTTVNTLHLLEG